MTTINQSWSAAPAPGSGHAGAAPPIRRGKPDSKPSFTIDGIPADQLRQQRQDAKPVPHGTADAYAIQQHAAKAFGEHLANVRANKDLSPQGIENAIAAFQDTLAAKAAGQAHQAVQQHAADAKANVEAVRSSLVQPGDSAQELRNTRIWNRLKAQLDNADSGKVGVIARQLLSQADLQSIAVLAEELGAYLDARGVESDWVPTALTQAVPELGRAEQDARTAQRYADVISANHATLQRSFQSRHAPTTLVDPSVVGA